MIEFPYQSIFDVLHNVIPNGWDRLVFYAEYSKDSMSMKYFVRFEDGVYCDCFNLNEIDRKEVLSAFSRIDELIKPVWDDLPSKDQWSMMTFVIDHLGKFKVDYVYEDLSENFMDYYYRWKKRYLI